MGGFAYESIALLHALFSSFAEVARERHPLSSGRRFHATKPGGLSAKRESLDLPLGIGEAGAAGRSFRWSNHGSGFL